MPHNRYFISQDLHSKMHVELRETEHHHLCRVMRQQEGEEVELINGKGALAIGTISKLSPKSAVIELTDVKVESPKNNSCILALAYLKPSHLEFALEKATEIGVDTFWLFPGQRSEKKTLSENQLLRLETITISAMKQCGRLYLPKIEIKKTVSSCDIGKSFALFGDVEQDAQAFETIRQSLKGQKEIILFIGPESGFSDHELTHLRSKHAMGVHFLSNTLRAETAAIVGSTLIQEAQFEFTRS